MPGPPPCWCWAKPRAWNWRRSAAWTPCSCCAMATTSSRYPSSTDSANRRRNRPAETAARAFPTQVPAATTAFTNECRLPEQTATPNRVALHGPLETIRREPTFLVERQAPLDLQPDLEALP